MDCIEDIEKCNDFKSTCINYNDITYNGTTYRIHMEKVIGFGVDGIIYNSTIGDNEIVVKIMKKCIMSDIELLAFIRINKIAHNKNIGPIIYDIFTSNELIYIFMEKMEINLTQWIMNLYLEDNTWCEIKTKVKDAIYTIHCLMINEGITLGDKTLDNYMFKNGKIKKIDFTMSKIKDRLTDSEHNNFKEIFAINPFSNLMEKIQILKFIKINDKYQIQKV